MVADLKPYPEYRTAGRMAGRIPSHWPVRRMKNVARRWPQARAGARSAEQYPEELQRGLQAVRGEESFKRFVGDMVYALTS